MSLYSDLNEVLTPYAQRIKGLLADISNKADKSTTYTKAEVDDELSKMQANLQPLNMSISRYIYTASSGYQNIPMTLSAGEYVFTAYDCGINMMFRNANNENVGPTVSRYADKEHIIITNELAEQIAYIRMYGGHVDVHKYPNVLERVDNVESDIGAVAQRIDFGYTDNDVINVNIKECKVEIFNNSVDSIKIEIPQNVTTYITVRAYSSDTQVESKTCAFSIYYDSATNLFLCATSNFRIRMIISFDFLTSTHIAYVGTYQALAYGHSALFDTQNFPYDKHITDFAPFSSGDPLSRYMGVRDAIKEIYVNSKQVTGFDIINTGYIRLKSGSTNLETIQLEQNYIGTIWYGDSCGIYIDTTHIFGLSLSNVSVTRTSAEDNPIMSSRHIFYCGANRNLQTLKAGIEAAEQYMDSVLYVDEGDYDLISEFGADYFANLPDTDQQAGLKLCNRIHVIFSPNSRVMAHYTGSNANVCTCFSPFNNGKYGFTLENLTLYSSRTRYGVHDVGGTVHNDTKYINCHIEQDNSNNEYWSSNCAIGAGLGKQQDTEISGCLFKGRVYWHLTSNLDIVDYRATVRCSDSYFIDDTIQVSASRNDAQNNTEFVFSGNSLKQVSGADPDGLIKTIVQDGSADIYAWNNEIRT